MVRWAKLPPVNTNSCPGMKKFHIWPSSTWESRRRWPENLGCHSWRGIPWRTAPSWSSTWPWPLWSSGERSSRSFPFSLSLSVMPTWKQINRSLNKTCYYYNIDLSTPSDWSTLQRAVVRRAHFGRVLTQKWLSYVLCLLLRSQYKIIPFITGTPLPWRGVSLLNQGNRMLLLRITLPLLNLWRAIGSEKNWAFHSVKLLFA